MTPARRRRRSRGGAALAATFVLLVLLVVGTAAPAGSAGAEHRPAGPSSSAAASSSAVLLRRLSATLRTLDDSDTRTAIRSSLVAGVALQRAVRDELAGMRPQLRRARRLMVDLRPGLRALRETAPAATATLRRGTATAKRVPPVVRGLHDPLDAARRLAQDPVLPRSLRRQRHTVTLARPVLRRLVPAQVDHHAITRAAERIGDALSEGGAFGTWAPLLVLWDPQQLTSGAGG